MEERLEAARGRLAALLDFLSDDWKPIDSADSVPLYLLCGAGLAELRFSGRAWTNQSALDFEATARGVWIDAERKSVLPDEIRHAVPAWASLAVAVQLNVPVQARLTADGATCKQEVREVGSEWLLEFICSHPIRGRVTIRLLGNEGPAPGAVEADTVMGHLLRAVQEIAESQRTIAAAVSGGAAAKAERCGTAVARRGPGRPKAEYETVQREAQIAAEWERARESRIYKGDFAREHGLSVTELDALLDRVRKRNCPSE